MSTTDNTGNTGARGERGRDGMMGETGIQGLQGEPGPKGRSDSSSKGLRRAFHFLTLTTIGLSITIVIVGFIGFIYMRSYAEANRELAVQTTDSICALKHDFEQRIEDSEAFLADHPNGIPGITPEAIQQSIDNTQRTLNALSGIDCPVVIK